MSKTKFILVALLSVAMLFGGVYFYRVYASHQISQNIQDFNYETDAAQVDALFHKNDNWYWMMHNMGLHTYSLDFTLRYRSSSQTEKLHDLVLKVFRQDGKIVGFLAYWPHSQHVWQLLFLIVDQDYRRQGIAKKMLKFALDDMAQRGAFKVIVATRNNNFRSQSLYRNFGLKQTAEDDQFVYFSWYK